MASIFSQDTVIEGTLRVIGGILPSIPRSSLVQDDLKSYIIPLSDLRRYDAFHTLLTSTSTSTYLGLNTGTFGTDCPYVMTSDLKTAGAVTRYARFMAQLPAEYVAGESVIIRAAAGMLTTVADVTCTLDFEAYLVARDTLKSGSDLVQTAATSINSLTFSNKDFSLTASTLSPGSWLDVRMTIATNDAASATTVRAVVAALELLCDVRG